MDTIRDTDLILYHYRDGLAVAQIDAITRALAQSPALAQRYRMLVGTLQAVDTVTSPVPDAGFDIRLHNVLDARIDAWERDKAKPARREGGWLGWLLAPGPRLALGGALALALAVGVGYEFGRGSVSPAAPPLANTTPADSNAMPSRVLDAYVASHLRATEGAVLTAVNSDSAEILAGNRELAAGLIDSNRLYATAAARAGNTRLAEFLRQLEPLLIELANPPDATGIQSTDGLRNYLDKTDLLFQLRAIEKRIDPGARRPTSA